MIKYWKIYVTVIKFTEMNSKIRFIWNFFQYICLPWNSLIWIKKVFSVKSFWVNLVVMRFTEISNKKIGAKLTERSNKNIVI